MKRVKGCLNSACSEYRKTYFKTSDDICPKCGAELSYICKHHGCFKQLPTDSKEKFCAVHLAEKRDNNEKRWNMAKKGAAALGSFALVVGTIVKAVIDEKK